MTQRSSTPFALGLLVALLSAASFGSSGTFGAALLATGWSPGAIVTARITGGALLMLLPALYALRGRWYLLRRNARTVVLYGLLAVAGCQLAYFSAVQHLSVGVALLLEYLAPVLLVGWMWARHGRRPTALTLGGVLAALVGLGLVLDVTSGARIAPAGLFFGLLSAIGLMSYFLLSADGEDALPPIAYAGFGLAVGAVTLVVSGLVGVLPMTATADDVVLAGWQAPWWVAIVELAVVAAAAAYALGVASVRMLGVTLSSFVGLSEVLFAVIFAWVLVGQALAPVQVLGGLAILLGVILVKVGESRLVPAAAGAQPAELVPDAPAAPAGAPFEDGLGKATTVH